MPSAAVGEATAGVAVEAAGAAIPAVVKETRADHGAGQRGDSRPGGEDGRAAGRSDHGSGQGDPGRSRGGAERASKPGGEDGAALEVTAEVGASKPYRQGTWWAGPVTARRERPCRSRRGRGARAGPGRGTRSAVCRRAGPRIPAQRGERRRGRNRAHTARRVNAHGWGRGGMRGGMEGLKIWVRGESKRQGCVSHLDQFDGSRCTL